MQALVHASVRKLRDQMYAIANAPPNRRERPSHRPDRSSSILALMSESGAATETSSGDAVTMEKIVALCKRRGFVFPSSEIYGGLSSSYDYGHYGVLLKNNVKAAWW